MKRAPLFGDQGMYNITSKILNFCLYFPYIVKNVCVATEQENLALLCENMLYSSIMEVILHKNTDFIKD